MRTSTTDFDAPAPKARRMRYKSLFLALLLMLFVMGLAVVAGAFGLEKHRLVLVFLAIIWVGSWLVFMIWNALRYNYVPCPRCGWNIFYRKPMPMGVFNIPSVCPNCGLDLERTYAAEGTPARRSGQWIYIPGESLSRTLGAAISTANRAGTSAVMAAFVAGLIAVVFIGIAGGSNIVPRLIYLHDLAASHRVTQGEVIETFPEMHSTCKYRYLVGGQSYEQTGVACGRDNVGQQITVYFSTVDPGKSLNEDPASAFVNDLIPFIAALTIFPTVLALVTFYRAR